MSQMQTKTLIVSLFLLFINIGLSQSEKIKIKSDHLKESNYLKMDDFYLTHHLYIDLFLRENLFPEATVEDVSSVLTATRKYVSVENKLDIEIERPGQSNYLIRIAVLKKDDDTELLIAFTNWNTKKRMFENEIDIENDSYTRWYFLNGSKMTYRKDMSNQNDYSKMSKADLANAYLLDELSENDSEITNTIDDILSENGLSVSENIMANLLLLKNQIFQRNNEGVLTQTEYLEQLFETNRSESNLRGLQVAFNATKFQIQLMK